MRLISQIITVALLILLFSLFVSANPIETDVITREAEAQPELVAIAEIAGLSSSVQIESRQTGSKKKKPKSSSGNTTSAATTIRPELAGAGLFVLASAMLVMA